MHHIYSISAYIVFVLFALPLALILSLTPSLKLRRKITRRFARMIIFCMGIKLIVSGLEKLPENNCIVIANHASYLDGLILSAALPPKFTYVIKREVTSVPILHLLLRKIGSHFVERTNRTEAANHLKKMIRHAQAGESIAIFPEGTFRAEPGLRAFQKGAFAVAHKTNIAMVPVYIHGARKALPAQEWKLTRHPLHVEIQSSIKNPSSYATVNELKDAAYELFTEAVGDI